MLKADSVTPVETEDFLDIVEQAVNICVSCTKKGEEAQGCRLAALFIKYDIEPLDKDAGGGGKCPVSIYRGGGIKMIEVIPASFQ